LSNYRVDVSLLNKYASVFWNLANHNGGRFMKFNSKKTLSLFLVLFLGLAQATCAHASHKEQGKKLGEKVDKAEKKVEEKSKELANKAKEKYDGAKEKVKEKYDDAKEKVHEKTE